MNDIASVAIFNAVDDLGKQMAGFAFGNGDSTLDQVKKVASSCQLHHHHDVVGLVDDLV